MSTDFDKINQGLPRSTKKINIIMVCVVLEEWSTDFGAVEFLKY
jgi:hypothetical protein